MTDGTITGVIWQYQGFNSATAGRPWMRNRARNEADERRSFNSATAGRPWMIGLYLQDHGGHQRFNSATLGGGLLDEALHDNTRTPVPDQAAFRLDWPRWLATLSGRDQSLILDLALGEPTSAAAAKYAVSPSRISQKRREFQTGWMSFGEGPTRQALVD